MWVAGFYDRTARPRNPTDPVPVEVVSAPSPAGTELPGLPPHLEASLAQAQQGGQEELGKWLRQWGRQVQDPRLAWIELDYREGPLASRFQCQASVGPAVACHYRPSIPRSRTALSTLSVPLLDCLDLSSDPARERLPSQHRSSHLVPGKAHRTSQTRLQPLRVALCRSNSVR